jgi:hypothetical protein
MKHRTDHANVHTPAEEHAALATTQSVWVGEARSECDEDLRLAAKYKSERDKISPSEQHRIAMTVQHQWSVCAKRDAAYNLKQAERFKKDGHGVLENGYKQEFEWCQLWYNRRKRLAGTHKKLMKTDHRDKLVLYKMYMQEYRWCISWIEKRLKLEQYHIKMAKR